MKRIIILIFSLVIFFNIRAQLLWAISGNGLSKPSYMFVTHHFAPKSIFVSVPGVYDIYKNIDCVYAELVFTELTNHGDIIKKYMTLQQDSLLDVILTNDQYKKEGELIKCELGMDINNAKMLKPVVLVTTIEAKRSLDVFPDFDSEFQLDTYFQKLALEKNIEVKGLETLEQQCKLLFGTSLSAQIENLMKYVENPEKYIEISKRSSLSYMSQDIDKLKELMNEDDDDTGMTKEEVESIIIKRNRDWAEQLKSILPHKSILLVVGAAHLPAEEGMIDLLEKQGYTLTGIRSFK